MDICFATNNSHKLHEVAHLLGERFHLISLREIGVEEELAEDFLTLEENAFQKAHFIFSRYQIACFADDTGLEVEALDGRPGVFSARYAGPQRNSANNIARLLKELSGVTNRRAQFRTVISLIEGKDKYMTFEGVVKGEIIDDQRGAAGFGYDPVFLPEGSGKTLAEMSMEEKNKLSHRAKAIQKMVAYLKK